jgi:hypothetical protein
MSKSVLTTLLLPCWAQLAASSISSGIVTRCSSEPTFNEPGSQDGCFIEEETIVAHDRSLVQLASARSKVVVEAVVVADSSDDKLDEVSPQLPVSSENSTPPVAAVLAVDLEQVRPLSSDLSASSDTTGVPTKAGGISESNGSRKVGALPTDFVALPFWDAVVAAWSLVLGPVRQRRSKVFGSPSTADAGRPSQLRFEETKTRGHPRVPKGVMPDGTYLMIGILGFFVVLLCAFVAVYLSDLQSQSKLARHSPRAGGLSVVDKQVPPPFATAPSRALFDGTSISESAVSSAAAAVAELEAAAAAAVVLDPEKDRGLPLCPSLVVPRGNKCVLMLRAIPADAPVSSSSGWRDILDSKGSLVLKAILRPQPEPEATPEGVPGARSSQAVEDAPGARSNQAVEAGEDMSAAQTSAVTLHFPVADNVDEGSSSSRSQVLGICRRAAGDNNAKAPTMFIYNSEDKLFGVLSREHKGEPKCGDSPGKAAQYMLSECSGGQLTFEGNYFERNIVVMRASGEAQAHTEFCAEPFEAGVDFYKLHISSTVDAGLIVCALLSVEWLEKWGDDS